MNYLFALLVNIIITFFSTIFEILLVFFHLIAMMIDKVVDINKKKKRRRNIPKHQMHCQENNSETIIDKVAGIPESTIPEKADEEINIWETPRAYWSSAQLPGYRYSEKKKLGGNRNLTDITNQKFNS